MISLKYQVTADSQGIDSGVLQYDASDTGDSYAPSNILQLLQPLFIPGNADGTGWTVDNNTFKTKAIVGTQTTNPQGGTDLLGFIGPAPIDEGVIDMQTYLDNLGVDISIVAKKAKTMVTFSRNELHDGQENRPLDYFDVLKTYLPIRIAEIELRGLRVAESDATTITFKAGCYIPIVLPDAEASYIHIQ